MTYEKPYKSPQQQVDLLASRGMVITNSVKAQHCLSRIGYYRLSAYWYPFREILTSSTGEKYRGDNFVDAPHFSTIHDLYVFDKRLRMIVMDGLERIEIGLRTQIALSMGAIDPWAHRNPSNLQDSFTKELHKSNPTLTKYEFWLRSLDKKYQDSKEDFAKHFKKKYPTDPLPIWVAVELWDFGTLSHFFNGMRQVDKDKIASIYKVPPGRLFGTWIRCLNDIRNLCAHHSRLWNRALVNQPQLPKIGVLPVLDHLHDDVNSHTRLYAALVIIEFLMKSINPSSDWRIRLVSHIATLPPNAYITLHSAGFSDSWSTQSLWLPAD